MDKKLQDELIGALIGLARATEGTSPTKEIYQTIIQGLTKYNAIDISDDEVRDLIQDVRSKKKLLVPECSKCQSPCGRNDEYDMQNIWNAKEDIRKLCPMAMHVAFPYVDILRYGGKLPSQPEGVIKFSCPMWMC